MVKSGAVAMLYCYSATTNKGVESDGRPYSEFKKNRLITGR